jgi:hypothetical protein
VVAVLRRRRRVVGIMVGFALFGFDEVWGVCGCSCLVLAFNWGSDTDI